MESPSKGDSMSVVRSIEQVIYDNLLEYFIKEDIDYRYITLVYTTSPNKCIISYKGKGKNIWATLPRKYFGFNGIYSVPQYYIKIAVERINELCR